MVVRYEKETWSSGMRRRHGASQHTSSCTTATTSCSIIHSSESSVYARPARLQHFNSGRSVDARRGPFRGFKRCLCQHMCATMGAVPTGFGGSHFVAGCAMVVWLGAMGSMPWARWHGPDGMGSVPWARCHAMGSVPWARCHAMAPYLEFRTCWSEVKSRPAVAF